MKRKIYRIEEEGIRDAHYGNVESTLDNYHEYLKHEN